MTDSGLVIVAKSAGMTSHDVVARIRRLAGTRRVGHAGTLDPMATGVLVVGVEKATRLLGHLALTEKEYAATIRLGQATTTDDADGEILAAPGRATASDLPEPVLRSALAAFSGEIPQVPPGISAIKVHGQRAYHLTRSGATPELAARTVTISGLDLLAIRPAGELLDVDIAVTCSSGTYIRAIARDLGAALGTGGHLTALHRTRVGPYLIGQARTLDQLAGSFELIGLAAAAAAAFPRRDLTAEEARLISHGVRIPAIGRAAAADGAGAADGASLRGAGSAGAEAAVPAVPGTVAGPGQVPGTGVGAADGASLRGAGSAAAEAAVPAVPGTVAGPGQVPGTGVSAADGASLRGAGSAAAEAAVPAVPGTAADPGQAPGRLPDTGGPVAAFGPDGTLIALLVEQRGEARSVAVFVP